MKIAIIGASGKAGSLILKEALDRKHEVTAIVRNAGKLSAPATAILEKDVFDLSAEELRAFDVVVNAFGAAPGQEHLHVDAGRALIKALHGAPETRLIVVGGAGSLFVNEEETVRLVDTPEFPDLYKPTAQSQAKNLADLQQTSGIQWTFVSPSAFFDANGPRTGAYQAGANRLLVNSKNESYISYADFAIAILDEIEHPRHINERFTVVAEGQ